MNATINDPLLRTLNRGAVAGSAADIYKHNPWRAPGTAPMFDSCGMAGGSPQHTHLCQHGSTGLHQTKNPVSNCTTLSNCTIFYCCTTLTCVSMVPPPGLHQTRSKHQPLFETEFN